SHAWRLVRFTGDPGVTIPRGFLNQTQGAVRYATTEAAVIGPDGHGEVTTRSVGTGWGVNVSPDQLNVITNPVPGVSGVIGLESDRNVDGLDRETDRELRERYYLSLAAGGASTIDSIRAAVLKTPGVRRSEEHTSELQSRENLVCRLLLEKKNK